MFIYKPQVLSLGLFTCSDGLMVMSNDYPQKACWFFNPPYTRTFASRTAYSEPIYESENILKHRT